MSKISVVINTFNEERNIENAIKSVRNVADEVLVCDMYSDDDTVLVAKKLGAVVYRHKRTGYVEPARNYAISKATGNWILILDADEEISSGLANELEKIVNMNKADYYRLPRKNIVFGKWIKHSRWWPDYNIRFFKKGFVTWNEIIHSVPLTTGRGADLVARVENSITHHHYETVDQYVERLNRYTTYQKKHLQKKGYRFKWKDLFIGPTREFVGRFFQGEGYKDGVHGLALALLQAFSELVLYLKVWQEEKFPEKIIDVESVTEEIKNAQRELNYWVSDTKVKNGGNLTDVIKRKFKLL